MDQTSTFEAVKKSIRMQFAVCSACVSQAELDPGARDTRGYKPPNATISIFFTASLVGRNLITANPWAAALRIASCSLCLKTLYYTALADRYRFLGCFVNFEMSQKIRESEQVVNFPCDTGKSQLTAILFCRSQRSYQFPYSR